QSSPTLLRVMVRTTRPHAEPLEAWVPPRNSSSTTATAPVRLPRMETAQCLSITAVEMRLDSQGTGVIAGPVDRSEPLMTANHRPTETTSPPSTLATTTGQSVVPCCEVTMNTKPSAMYAPPVRESRNMRPTALVALAYL